MSRDDVIEYLKNALAYAEASPYFEDASDRPYAVVAPYGDADEYLVAVTVKRNRALW